MYRLALGAVADSEALSALSTQSFEDSVWWESVIALGTFERGVLRSVRLQPIDLGVNLPITQRGAPRRASLGRGTAILERLSELSRPFRTPLPRTLKHGMLGTGKWS